MDLPQVVVDNRHKNRIRWMMLGLEDWHLRLKKVEKISVTVGGRAERINPRGLSQPIGPKFKGERVWVSVPKQFSTDWGRRSFSPPMGYSNELYAIGVHSYIEFIVKVKLRSLKVLAPLDAKIVSMAYMNHGIYG